MLTVKQLATSPAVNPGVYDITIAQYHAGPGISRSGIETFKRSPLHYWHEYLNPEKAAEECPEIITKSSALHYGNAFHTYVLERSEFEKRYMLVDKVDRRTNAGKEAAARALQEAKGRQLICSESFQDIINMDRAIGQSSGRSLIDGAAYEKSLFWIDKDTDILCKVRPDAWHKNMVIDLKTTTNASARKFAQDVYSYGYYIQCAMIAEALQSIYNIKMDNFLFVAVEKEAPYAVAVYPLAQAAIAKGREEFKKILFEMKECMLADNWPGYAGGEIDLPAYAYKDSSEDLL